MDAPACDKLGQIQYISCLNYMIENEISEKLCKFAFKNRL